MTTDATLAALTAGLDRDEAIARAAAERSADWTESDCAVVGGELTPAEPEYGITETGEYVIVYDEGSPRKPEAIHIAAFDPARVLRQVEAHRKVIADYHDARDALNGLTDNQLGWEERARVNSLESTLTALAGIYTEPTEEGTAG